MSHSTALQCCCVFPPHDVFVTAETKRWVASTSRLASCTHHLTPAVTSAPAPPLLAPPCLSPFVSLQKVHTAVSGVGGQDDQAGRWRVRGNEFSLTVDRRSKSRMLEDLRYRVENAGDPSPHKLVACLTSCKVCGVRWCLCCACSSALLLYSCGRGKTNVD